MDFLDTLPYDCTVAIWELLDHKALHAAVRVSKAWSSAATPVLYREIRVEQREDFSCLLRAFERRPDLITVVRTLSITSCSNKIRLDEWNRELPEATALLRLLADHLQSLRILDGGKNAMCRSLFTPSHGPVYSLPNPRRLTIPLNNLRTFVMKGAVQIGYVSSCWAMPRFERIAIHDGSFRSDLWSLAPSAWPIAASMVDLELRDVIYAEDAVVCFLEHAPALKVFRYTVTLAGFYPRGGPLTDFDRLGRSLLPLHSTLETLELRVGAGSQSELPYTTPPSLHAFASLHDISISTLLLLRMSPEGGPELDDLLPLSLKHLKLYGCCVEDRVWLQSWTPEPLTRKLRTFFTARDHTRGMLRDVTLHLTSLCRLNDADGGQYTSAVRNGLSGLSFITFGHKDDHEPVHVAGVSLKPNLIVRIERPPA